MMDRLACGIAELKFDAGSEAEMTFSGYGAMFGNVDAYGDVISPGAFGPKRTTLPSESTTSRSSTWSIVMP